MLLTDLPGVRNAFAMLRQRAMSDRDMDTETLAAAPTSAEGAAQAALNCGIAVQQHRACDRPL